MEVYIFRHGETEYTQREVTIDQALDLTLNGEEIVRESVRQLTPRLLRDLPVVIHSSPFGRCLHTSKIVRDELSESGLEVDINVDPLVREVSNFEWNLFCPLVIGGNAEYNDNEFFVDKSLTNPQGLGTTRYFRSDSTHSLSQRARESLPLDYTDRISLFEKYPSVTARLDLKLESLKNDDKKSHIITTHEALTGKFVSIFTGKSNAFLDRGRYIPVWFSGNNWIPMNCGKNSICYD